MSRVQLCRFCCIVVPGSYWCERKRRCLSEEEMSVENFCAGFEFNALDVITLKRNYPAVAQRLRMEQKERALYERRMKGDWS